MDEQIQELIKQLEDENWQDSANAEEALGKLDGNRVVEALISVMQYKRSTAAIRVLGKMRDTRAVEPLVAALQDNDKWVRIAATQALGEIGDVRALEPLLAAFKMNNNSIIQQRAALWRKIVDDGNLASRVSELKDEDKKVREEANKLFQEIYNEHSKEFGRLADLEQDVEETRREEAIALIKIANNDTFDFFIEALKDEHKQVRKIAVIALVKIGDKHALEPIISVLMDEDNQVRKIAALALGKISDARAVESLIVTLKDREYSVWNSAIEALLMIGDLRAVEPFIAMLRDDSDIIMRQCAAEALGTLGDARAVDPLKAAMKDEYEYVRKSATIALGKIIHGESNKTADTSLTAWDLMMIKEGFYESSVDDLDQVPEDGEELTE